MFRFVRKVMSAFSTGSFRSAAGLSLLGFFALANMTGCGVGGSLSKGGSPLPTSAAVPVIGGRIIGGQQPVTLSTITMYAASTTAYGGQSRTLLTTTSDLFGNFTLSPGGVKSYSCQPGDLVYLVASGGNPGMALGTNNANLILMAALGLCSNLTPNTYITLNEVSTVAAVEALSPFVSTTQKTTAGGYDISYIGAPASNNTGLLNAFSSVPNLIDTVRGGALLTTPAGNGTVSTSTINTLADILAVCVNSDGTGFNCTYPQTEAAAPAADTYSVAVAMAKAPYANVSALLGVPSPTSPFQPTAPTTTNDLTVSVMYTGAGFSALNGLGIDATGNVWLTNRPASGTAALEQLSPTGALLKNITTNVAAPNCLAVDGLNDVWVTNDTEVDEFSQAGVYQRRAIPVLPGGAVGLSYCATDKSSNFVTLSNSGQGTDRYYQITPTAGAISTYTVQDGNGRDTPGVIKGVVDPVVDASGNVVLMDFLDIDQLDNGFDLFCPRIRAFKAGAVQYVNSANNVASQAESCDPYYGVVLANIPYPVVDANGFLYAGGAPFQFPDVGGVGGTTLSGGTYATAYLIQPALLTAADNHAGYSARLFNATGSNPGTQSTVFPFVNAKAAVSGTNQIFAVGRGYSPNGNVPGIIWQQSAVVAGSTTAALTQVTTSKPLLPPGMGIPTDIAIDGSGNLWVPSTQTSGSATALFQVIGVASPVVTPLGAAIVAGTRGTRP